MNAVCGAKKRGKDETCRGIAMANGRCRLHGGLQPQGIARPGFKTGRYSKYMPARLAGRYQEAISDPDLMALRDDIALLDTRLGSVVEALDTGESQEAWTSMLALVVELETQWSTLLDEGEPPEDMERTIDRLGQLVRQGMSQGYVWAEIRGLLKERAALVSGEQKRLVDMQQYVTSEQAMTFVGALMASVKRHVSDTRALANIAADITRFSVRGGVEPAVTGSATG